MTDASPHPDPFQHVTEHRGWIRRLAAGIVVDSNEVDDVEQQTWLAAVEAGEEGRGKVRGWFRTVARNAALKRVRSRKRVEERERRATPREPEESPADRAARLDAHLRVTRAVQELEPAYRDVVLLRYFDDLPVAGVAERLGIPLETARTRLRRAREQLRARLESEHGDERTRALFLLLLPRREFLLPRTVPWRLAAQVAGIAAAIASGVIAAVIVANPADDPAPAAAEDAPAVVEVEEGAPTEAPELRTARGASERVLVDPVARTVGVPAEPAPVDQPWGSEHDRAYRVVDSAGALITAATAVVLLGPHGRTLARHETTDADGCVTIGGIGPDRIEFSAPGFTPRVAPARSFVRSEVVLFRRAEIGGVIVDRDGRPVSGARGAIEQRDFEQTFVTGADGRFRADGLSAEAPTSYDATLSVEADGYLPEFRTFAPGRTDLHVVLDRPCIVEGRVLDPQGRPAAQAEVIFWGNLPRAQGANAVTDAQGRFRLDTLRHGRHVVWSRHGHRIVPQSERSDRWTSPRGMETLVELAPGEHRTGLELELEARDVSFVVVRVYRDDGTVASGVRTCLRGVGGHVRSNWEATDEGGLAAHRVALPAASAVDLLVQPQGSNVVPPSIVRVRTVGDAGAPPQAVTLAAGTRWVLRLLDVDGDPVTAARGTRLTPDVGFRNGWLVDDASWGTSTVRVFVLPESAGRVVVERAGFAPAVAIRDASDAPESETVLTLLRGATVRGTIVDADGTLIGGAEVRSRTAAAVGARNALARSGGLGVFRLTGLAPGEHVLEITRGDGLVEQRLTLALDAGAEVDLGTIELAGWRSVSGRVLDADGSPLAGAHVSFSVEPLPGDVPEREHGIATDVDGRFALRLPRAARGSLWVAYEGRGVVRIPVRENASLAPVDVRLQPQAQLLVHLLLPPDAQFEDWRVRPDDGAPGWDATTAADLEFERGRRHELLFDELPAGGLEVTVRGVLLPRIPWERKARVELAAGQTTEVTIELRSEDPR